jgi:uncharacterized protein (UPF0261 family)
MPRRTRTTAAGLAACAAIAGAAAIPSLGGAQPPAGSELTLKLKVVGSAPITHGRKAGGSKLPAGDGMIIRLKVFDAAGAPVGRAYTECTNVGRKAASFDATLQCTQTYDLADGQIVSAGVIRFSELADAKTAIVGGSGAYRGAKGELVAGPPAAGFDSVDVLRFGD